MIYQVLARVSERAELSPLSLVRARFLRASRHPPLKQKHRHKILRPSGEIPDVKYSSNRRLRADEDQLEFHGEAFLAVDRRMTVGRNSYGQIIVRMRHMIMCHEKRHVRTTVIRYL